MTILFNVDERSGNYVFENDNPSPIPLMTRVVSYALGAYNAFIESFVVKPSKKGSFDWKMRGLDPFLLVESDSTPPPRLSFLQTLPIKILK
jgi:hypothetical protein